MTVSAPIETMAMRLKTLLYNGKQTPWASEEQRRYYELVVAKLLDPAAPAMPPGMRASDVTALLARLDQIDRIALRTAPDNVDPRTLITVREVRELLDLDTRTASLHSY